MLKGALDDRWNNLCQMSLTNHLHRKSNPIRSFLDERLVDFGPAKQKWYAAQDPGLLVDWAYDWTLVGMAIDFRIRMIFEPIRIEDSYAGRNRMLQSTFESVISKYESLRQKYSGDFRTLSPHDETLLLQVCYLFALYETRAQRWGYGGENWPLRTLSHGAKWQAHLNRLSKRDIEVLDVLVKPALHSFIPLVGGPFVIGPVFRDSELVDGADADLIVEGNLIEIKAEAPGFHSSAVRQAISYCLLDSDSEFDLKRCSIYLARFGTFVTWDLNQIILELSHNRYGYESLRDEFHNWLVAQRTVKENVEKLKRDELEESRRKFPDEWKALDLAAERLRKTSILDRESYDLANSQWIAARAELQRRGSEPKAALER